MKLGWLWLTSGSYRPGWKAFKQQPKESDDSYKERLRLAFPFALSSFQLETGSPLAEDNAASLQPEKASLKDSSQAAVSKKAASKRTAPASAKVTAPSPRFEIENILRCEEPLPRIVLRTCRYFHIWSGESFLSKVIYAGPGSKEAKAPISSNRSPQSEKKKSCCGGQSDCSECSQSKGEETEAACSWINGCDGP